MQNKETARKLLNFFVNFNSHMKIYHNYHNDSRPITEQQFKTMLNLKILERCTLKELSEKLNLSSSSTCIMLNKLDEEGYITRESDTKDRRNTFYSLSNKGQEFLNEDLDKKLDIIGSRLEKLSEDKLERLISSMNEFQEILKEIKSL
ncbi:organic hydroperoxide resistance transcriptional regulator [Oxobacter pfennigii]|uniref:Organic hydroperoxide resistance transcriptional regulator n=1 Tax=Oxobacter pfennigii TaxID=36849 RepID=A0A0P8YZ63_9CLOT|nr:MarR family transcriptional regulator [Oxobacter pfennigii]KPU45130.1 organic hydroperoxide resistance transcriptional regulator [Oxobacter pfennigii]